MEQIIFPDMPDHRVKAFFTGKRPGVDLERISEISSVERGKIYLPMQRHTDRVVMVDGDLDAKIGDAVITRRNDIVIGVQAADCVPVLLYDRVNRVAGAVHAGWRGTAAGILKLTIEAMSERFFSSPSNITVAIGPGIRWCCYNVGHEVIEAVRKATGEGDYYKNKGDIYYLDLQSSNSYQALGMGVPQENIWLSGECTYCLPEKYYSYRFAKGSTGRQGGFIRLL
ncbi:MAG TPA: peptidoglycan editing factor PgeF [Thermodesulfovibrionales bacterium]|nr:peptidoglycan editing factor PgeF [Thermodesulfovibrionales bacterium]